MDNGSRPAEITALLQRVGRGEAAAMDRLMPLVYEELQHLARHHRHGWRDVRTPGTQSLVHEAYLRLAAQEIDWQSRRQFFYIASRAMRSILVDNARRAARQKREGKRVQVELTEDMLISDARGGDLIEVDAAMTRLQASDERLAQIVDCRVFGGLTIEETAEALDVSPATVKRDWAIARAWLYQELKPSSGR